MLNPAMFNTDLKFFLFFFALLLIPRLPGILQEPGEANGYVLQAKSFLSGRIEIPMPTVDVAYYQSRYYVYHPPFPSILLLPGVALLGSAATKAGLVAIALGAINAVLLRRIFIKIDVPSGYIIWLIAGFIFGTAHWFVVRGSGWSSGYFAQVVAVTCALAAIDETFGKRRGFLMGLFTGLSFLSRQLTLFLAPFLLFYALAHMAAESRFEKFKYVLAFFAPLITCLAAYLVFNYFKFGNPLDTGYAYMYLREGHLWWQLKSQYGLFHPVYIPSNFITFFLQGFAIQSLDPRGLTGFYVAPLTPSLVFGSPFLFTAFWAKVGKKARLVAWLCIVASASVLLLFIGAIRPPQINAVRYTLDFLPLLMVLVADGSKAVSPVLWKLAIVYSILLNVLAFYGLPLANLVLSY